MDLGSSICTPKKPACVLCPFNDDCVARSRGEQESLSAQGAEKTGALRRGAAFVVTRGDQLLVRSRAEKGLLGGMTEVPGSDWLAAQDDKAALKQAPALKGVARWHRKAEIVTHVFTHFPLELAIYTAELPARARAPEGCAGYRWRRSAVKRCPTLCARRSRTDWASSYFCGGASTTSATIRRTSGSTMIRVGNTTIHDMAHAAGHARRKARISPNSSGLKPLK